MACQIFRDERAPSLQKLSAANNTCHRAHEEDWAEWPAVWRAKPECRPHGVPASCYASFNSPGEVNVLSRRRPSSTPVTPRGSVSKVLPEKFCCGKRRQRIQKSCDKTNFSTWVQKKYRCTRKNQSSHSNSVWNATLCQQLPNVAREIYILCVYRYIRIRIYICVKDMHCHLQDMFNSSSLSDGLQFTPILFGTQFLFGTQPCHKPLQFTPYQCQQQFLFGTQPCCNTLAAYPGTLAPPGECGCHQWQTVENRQWYVREIRLLCSLKKSHRNCTEGRKDGKAATASP